MENCQNWFYLCLLLITALLIVVIMSYNYSLKLERNQIKLQKEIQEVERVNGKEKADIKELQIKTRILEEVLQKHTNKHKKIKN